VENNAQKRRVNGDSKENNISLKMEM